jgi:hypothetical protein
MTRNAQIARDGDDAFVTVMPELSDGRNADVELPVLTISRFAHPVHSLGRPPHRFRISLRGNGLSNRRLKLGYQLWSDGGYFLVLNHRSRHVDFIPSGHKGPARSYRDRVASSCRGRIVPNPHLVPVTRAA